MTFIERAKQMVVCSPSGRGGVGIGVRRQLRRVYAFLPNFLDNERDFDSIECLVMMVAPTGSG